MGQPAQWASRSIPRLGRLLLLAGIAAAACLGGSPHLRPAVAEPIPDRTDTQRPETLTWDAGEGHLSANLRDRPLSDVLARISHETGWEVFVDPDLEAAITVKFQETPLRKALQRLFGGFNYAVVSAEDGSTRLFVYRQSRQEATQRVTEEPKEEKAASADSEEGRIPEELVVSLSPEGSESIEEIADRVGAEIVGKVEELGLYRLAFADEEAANAGREHLEKEEAIEEISANYRYPRPAPPQTLHFDAPIPSFNFNVQAGENADEVVIGLIDTDVQREGASAEMLMDPIELASGDEVEGVDKAQADAGVTHGTSMFETILRGLSADAARSAGRPVRVLPVDVYSGRSETSLFEVAQGMHRAIDAGARIINLSLGGDGNSPFMERLISEASQQDILVLGAAGNEPSTRPTYPAAYPEVLAVTAGDVQGRIAPYANRGDFVDVVGPGTSFFRRDNQSYMVSGTSAATAYVSGLAAAKASRQESPLSEIDSELRESLRVPREDPAQTP